MKVAICAKGQSMTAEVDERFGRCHFFALVDLETANINYVSNEAAAEQGAGVKAARILLKAGVNAVIVDNIGPKPMDILKKAEVRVFGGLRGSVQETLARFKTGELPELLEANN